MMWSYYRINCAEKVQADLSARSLEYMFDCLAAAGDAILAAEDAIRQRLANEGEPAMLSDAFQPHLLDPKESPVLEAREIMTQFPKRWVFVEVTEDYAPYEYDGFRGRVIAEAPTRKTLTPLVYTARQRWDEARYIPFGIISFSTNCTPPRVFSDMSLDVDE
jgi:hypothetical protein